MKELLCILALLSFACRSTETAPPPAAALPGPGVFVVNEGGFSGGGILSFYEREHDTLINGAGGRGWVFPNDMKIARGRGFVAVNGLDRVDEVDLSSGAVVRSVQLAQFTGPEFLAQSGGMLWTANAGGSVTLINTSADTVVWTSAKAVGFPGGIAVSHGRVFVSDAGLYPAVGMKLAVVDSATGALLDTVRIGGGPGPIASLGGSLYVLCSSGGTIVRVDPASPAAAESLAVGGYFSDMATDGTYLYAMSADTVLRVSVLPFASVPLLGRSTGIYFYAIGADSTHAELYLATITSGGGAGEMEIYTTAGARKRAPMPAGTFPGAFAVKQ